jgi:hypothetical protein
MISLGQALPLGIKGGMGFAKLSGDDIGDCDWRQGMNIGVFTEYSILNLVTIQPELLYVKKGAEAPYNLFSDQDIPIVDTYMAKLDYLEMPVLASVSVPLPSIFQPRIFAGPYVAYNLKSEGHYSMSSPSDLDFIKSFDYGAVIGVGTDVDLLVAKVMLDGRYTHGLASIHEDLDDIKNRTFSVMLGLLLNF